MRKLTAALVAALTVVPATALLVPPAEAGPPVDALVIRDEWGVPHVYADDAESLFFANGYVQAQDRLAQMEILRHVARGELAKLVGPSGLPMDLVARRELYTHDERVAAYEALEPDWKAAFKAYERGVNAWIDEVRADPAKLPVEYPALAIVPEPWDVTDTIAIAQYLLDVFGRGSGGQEVENAMLWWQLAKRLHPDGPADGDVVLPPSDLLLPRVDDALDDLLWVERDPGATYTTIKPGDAAPYASLPAERRLDLWDLPADQLEAAAAAMFAENVDDAEPTIADAAAAAGWPFRLGSNAQLVDARYTASGQPILFGGPQMGYFAPMIPYELGLHGAGFDAVGMGVAGAPGVIIGRAGNVSWTVTSGASDQVDVVAERLVVDDYHYEVDGATLAMDCRIERHLVRPGPADFAPSADPAWRPPLFDVVEQEVCRTIHGPVLYRADGYAFASNRSYRGDEVRSGTLWLQIGTIDSIEDFRALFADFAFTFNFNLAEKGSDDDPDGRIAYFHVGRQPLRDDRLDPRFPRPGWDSDYDWKGFAHLEDLPHVVDPASGYTVNWNNNPAVGWASGDARELWGAIHRAELMEEELLPLLARGDVTLDDVRRVNVNASTRLPYADDLFPLLRAAADDLGRSDVGEALDAWAADRFTMRDGDGDGHHDHAAFRLYELWRISLQGLVFEDELGAFTRHLSFDPATAGDPHAADHGDHTNKESVLVDAAASPSASAHAWCDDVGTAAVETCAEQAAAALAAALAVTVPCEDYGCPIVEAWTEPFPMRKSRFVPLGAAPAYEIDISNRPSFQHFYDWGLPEGPDRSRNALPPGASGHMNGADYALLRLHREGCEPCPLPPHLEDQLQMYAEYRDKPLLHARWAVEAHAERTLVIER